MSIDLEAPPWTRGSGPGSEIRSLSSPHSARILIWRFSLSGSPRHPLQSHTLYFSFSTEFAYRWILNKQPPLISFGRHHVSSYRWMSKHFPWLRRLYHEDQRLIPYFNLFFERFVIRGFFYVAANWEKKGARQKKKELTLVITWLIFSWSCLASTGLNKNITFKNSP